GRPGSGSFSSCRAKTGRNVADSAPSPNSLRVRLGIMKANENASQTGPNPNSRAEPISRNIPSTRLPSVEVATLRSPEQSRARPISGRGSLMRRKGRSPGHPGLNRPRSGVARRVARPELRAIEVELFENVDHPFEGESPFVRPHQDIQILHSGLG